jgi:uncharacterized protein
MRAAASTRSAAARPGLAPFLAAALAAILLLFVVPARATFQPPRLKGHVMDAAGELSEDQILRLDQKLARLRERTGFAIVALVVSSIGDETIEDVAYETFKDWKIGEKGKDNGVLLVIAKAERRVRIETGRGVGGALTDLQSNDIIRNVIGPELARGRFYEGIDRGTSAIARALLQGSPEPAGRAARPTAGAPASPLKIFGLLGLLALVIILAIVSPGFRQFLFFILFFGGRGGGSSDSY